MTSTPTTITRTCLECGRVFDLTDATDADEFTSGHDCEPLPDPLDLSPAAVDRLLADVLRPSLRDRVLAVIETHDPTECDNTRDENARVADAIVHVAREHFAQYVVVDVGLTIEQLDTIVAPPTRHEPMVCLRDELRETMRMAAAEVLAKHAALLS